MTHLDLALSLAAHKQRLACLQQELSSLRSVTSDLRKARQTNPSILTSPQTRRNITQVAEKLQKPEDRRLEAIIRRSRRQVDRLRRTDTPNVSVFRQSVDFLISSSVVGNDRTSNIIAEDFSSEDDEFGKPAKEINPANLHDGDSTLTKSNSSNQSSIKSDSPKGQVNVNLSPPFLFNSASVKASTPNSERNSFRNKLRLIKSSLAPPFFLDSEDEEGDNKINNKDSTSQCQRVDGSKLPEQPPSTPVRSESLVRSSVISQSLTRSSSGKSSYLTRRTEIVPAVPKRTTSLVSSKCSSPDLNENSASSIDSQSSDLMNVTAIKVENNNNSLNENTNTLSPLASIVAENQANNNNISTPVSVAVKSKTEGNATGIRSRVSRTLNTVLPKPGKKKGARPDLIFTDDETGVQV